MKATVDVPATLSPAQRLKLLRKAMSRQRLAAYVVPRQDEFQGEYVGAYAERLKWLTGFAGSWGTAIVARDKAALFIDSRYLLQVGQQVDGALYQFVNVSDERPSAWIEKNLKRGDRVGFDPDITSIVDARRLGEASNAVGAKLVPVAQNLVDEVWPDIPPRPDDPLLGHPLSAAGATARHKLGEVAAALTRHRAQATVLADPASVAWLLNIRGTDVPHTPVVLAYAIVDEKGRAELFVDPKRISPKLRHVLDGYASIRPPGGMAAALQNLGRKKETVLLDPSRVSERVRLDLVAAGAATVEGPDPCALPKARKNKVEQQGARNAHARDGAALCRFLCWLAGTAPSPGLSELTAADKLRTFREETGELKDLSFETISAAGPNAAIPHYHLEAGSELPLKRGVIYLVDSGAQYVDGTTDVTRTVIVGLPVVEMRDRFTRVLKGMISLSMMRFPKGTSGAHLDAVARAALWKAGLDFDHGTGHGVGSYLSVHEGPQGFSRAATVPLEPGMIISNEPGYYKADHYGIRIENLLMVTEAQEIAGGDRAMMGFETLTLAPIDRALIDTRLLDRAELDWLDRYHARVAEEISPLVDPDTQAWLAAACASLK